MLRRVHQFTRVSSRLPHGIHNGHVHVHGLPLHRMAAVSMNGWRRFQHDDEQNNDRNLTSEQRLEKLSGTLNEAFAVDIKRFEQTGRGLVASDDFSVGQQVIQEFPLGHILDPDVGQDYCHSCFNKLPQKAPPSKGMQIGNVNYEGFRERYCSDECHKAGKRDGHEMMWGIVDELAQYCSSNQVRQPLVALQMVCRSMVGDFELFWSQVEHLASVEPSQWTQQELDEFKEQYSLLRNALTVRLGGGRKEIDDLFENVLTLEWYTILRGLLRLNAFTIPMTTPCCEPPEFLSSYLHRNADPEKPEELPAPQGDPNRGLGTAVFLATSFINHHCEPNLDVSFSLGPTIRLHATRDIKKGEELTISYIDLNLPVTERKTKLATGYGFLCSGCDACEDFDHAQLFENSSSTASGR